MEASEEPISARRLKLNTSITSKPLHLAPKATLIHREALLDTLQALYDECTLESLQKHDKQIAEFVDKYKHAIRQLKQLRVNITDFEIKTVIGRGHFGEVHMVREKQTGDFYAMKTIKKSESWEKTSFDIERDIMAFNGSPWLTSLQYAFQDATYLFFVMELHPGGDLLGLLYRQGGTLPETAATFYIAELILALEDLHGMGYVHRDIKPDNILLDRCGHLKLADFGSAVRLNEQGVVVDKGTPVGTPDYVAPEVLQSAEGPKGAKRTAYGISCDFWSLGILAFELVVGKSPFSSQSTTTTYSKILNHTNNVKFPLDALLTQAYISFVRALIVEAKSRLNQKQIKEHNLFKNIHFDSLRDQVPPFVPKIASIDDTSNFSDIMPKKSGPDIENFKRRTQFSGRNLPFIGFTFTHDTGASANFGDRLSNGKDEIIKSLKEKLDVANRCLAKFDDFEGEKLTLERKVLEKGQKLENIEAVRNKLEHDLASSIAECAAVKRTLDIERKDRADLEKKALDLIKSAKMKWEASERTKIESLNLEIQQQNDKIIQLTTTNTLLNEQLQNAFKMENKHRESLNVVEKLSRRSVVGLESRLEKITIETKETVLSLQEQLTDARHEKARFEAEIRKFSEKERDMTKELKNWKQRYEHLKKEIENAEKVIRKLSDKVNQLENEMESIETYKNEVGDLNTQLNKEKVRSSDLKKRNDLLILENQVIEEYKNEINALKQMKIEMERKLNEVDTKLAEEVEKNGALKKQLENSEELANECQQLKEMRMKMWKIEKEFSNCKIDKRILERELKESEKMAAELKSEVSNLNDSLVSNRKNHEKALLELSNLNEKLSIDLLKTKDQLKNFEEKCENEKEKFDEEKIIVSELKSVIQCKEKKIEELNGQINGILVEKKILNNRCEDFESEKNRLLNELGECLKNKQQISNEMANMAKQLENTQLNLGALREACTLLENQVIEYEKLNEKIEAEKSSLNQNIEKLIADLCQAKEDIQQAKKSTNEEKSLRLLAETKCKRSSEEIDSLRIECENHRLQTNQYRELSNKLSDDLTISDEKCSDYEVTIKSYERQFNDLIIESNQLKEEISQYLTKIGQLKDTNYKFKQAINESKTIEIDLLAKIAEIERILNQKIAFYEERELKSDSTIKQQTKLIDYLQIKIDEQSHKKKTLTDKLFGSKKENQPPVLSLNYKDLENQLQKSKKQIAELHDEIYRLKSELVSRAEPSRVDRARAELVSPKTKLAMAKLVKSTPTNDLNRQNSIERMSHNIPHRFEVKLACKMQKCHQCNDIIQLGRMNVCRECEMIVHANCVDLVKGMCGLPKAYAEHYRDTLLKTAQAPNCDEETSDYAIEAWVKLLHQKTVWTRCFAKLNERKLVFLTSESGDLIHEMRFDDDGAKRRVVMEPLVSEIGVNVANSDLAFVLKIDTVSETSCWPISSIIFMALTLPERDKWFKALQRLFSDDASNYDLETCLKIPENLYVNCVFDLTKTIRLFGTDHGLFALHQQASLLKIDGLDKIEQISQIAGTNHVLMIVNAQNTLISCDFNHLLNLAQCAPCTKPQLTYKNVPINNLNSFHFLRASHVAKTPMFCAANTKQLILVVFNDEKGEFVPLRIMDTAEPVQCAFFTDLTLIVGADKYFEVDLQTFQAEEFLDSSDSNLNSAIKCHKLRSFPLAIMQVGDDPREFLLCFSELCVFVDEYGRSARDFELKPSFLPVGYEYMAPYLYVVHFGGVEVLRLGPDGVEASFMVDLQKMRFVGVHRQGVYVCHEGQVKVLMGKRVIGGGEGGDDCSSVVSKDGQSDRFSFTSSMVHSLDGGLSDESETDLERGVGKKSVHFSQTNL